MPGTNTKRYVNLRTNTLVEVFNEGSGSLRIATVTDDGYGRRRTVPATSFHESYLARNGQPHTSGYVPVNTLPGDHPHAMKTEIDRMELLENLDSLSNAELAAVIREHEQLAKEAKAVADRAKVIAKGRRKETGIEMYDDLVMDFTSGKKFDAPTAIRALSPERLHQISMVKPDATLAKKILGEGSEEYKSCLKDNGFTLTVREATDKDRLRLLAESGPEVAGSGDVEIFEMDDALS